MEEFFVDKICADMIRVERAYKVEAASFTKAVPGYDHPFSKAQYDGYLVDIEKSIETFQWIKKQILENRQLDKDGFSRLMSNLRVEPFGLILAYTLWLLNVVTYLLEKSRGHTLAELHQVLLKAMNRLEDYLQKTRNLVAERSKASAEGRYQVPLDRFVPIMRYRADAERSLFRDFLELGRLQAKRLGTPVIPPAVLDVRT